MCLLLQEPEEHTMAESMDVGPTQHSFVPPSSPVFRMVSVDVKVSRHTCTQGLYIRVHKACTYAYTRPVHTRTQGLYIHVHKACTYTLHKACTYTYTRPVHTRTQGLYIHVHKACTYTYTRPVHTCTQGLYIHVHKAYSYHFLMLRYEAGA